MVSAPCNVRSYTVLSDQEEPVIYSKNTTCPETRFKVVLEVSDRVPYYLRRLIRY